MKKKKNHTQTSLYAIVQVTDDTQLNWVSTMLGCWVRKAHMRIVAHSVKRELGWGEMVLGFSCRSSSVTLVP